MAWIELHQSLPSHRKTLDAADLLNLPPVYVVGHMTAFWLWALDNVPSGRLGNIGSRTIARAAQWDGDAEMFVNAITDAGFLERDGDGLTIHDWYAYAGKLIDRREQNTQRMRDARAPATVPNRTQPNRTGPKDHAAPNGAEPVPEKTKTPKPSKPTGYSVEFEAFWNDYPRRLSKAEAYVSYQKAQKRGVQPADLLIAARHYAEHCSNEGTEDRFIAHPTTFLNNDRYTDYQQRPVKAIPKSNHDRDPGPRYLTDAEASKIYGR